MFYSYGIGKTPQLGLYKHHCLSPVIVTLDPNGVPVALSSDRNSVYHFADQMGGWIKGGYEMVDPCNYLDA